MNINTTTRVSIIATFVLLGMTLINTSGTASALTDAQKKIFELGAGYYDDKIIDAETGNNTGGSNNPSGPLQGACNAEQIWNYLLGKQVQGVTLTEQLVAGIMGNMQAESGFYPNRRQGHPPSEGSDDATSVGGSGYGLVQWTPGRKIIPDFNRIKDTLDPPADKHSDMRFQLQLLLDQLNGIGSLSEAAAGRDLVRHESDTRGAAKSFMVRFERPADQSSSAQNSRADLADGVFNTGTSGQWNCQDQ